jgi:hypothetical protein
VTSRLRLAAGGVGLGTAALLARNVVKYKRATSERFELMESPQPGTPEFAHLLEAMTGAPQRPGNRVEVRRNGATLDAMVDAISEATRTIDFSSYRTSDRDGRLGIGCPAPMHLCPALR